MRKRKPQSSVQPAKRASERPRKPSISSSFREVVDSVTTGMISLRALEDLHIASQPLRFKILGCLSIADQSYVAELQRQLKLKNRASIWEHLTILQKAGMVRSRVDKQIRYFELTSKGQQILNRIRIPLSVPKISK